MLWDKHAPDCGALSQALAETWSGPWVTLMDGSPHVPRWQNTVPLSPAGSPRQLCCMKGSAADMTAHRSCVGRPIITGIFLTHHIGAAAGPDLVCWLQTWVWAEVAWESAEWKCSPTGSNQGIYNLHKRGGQGIVLLPVHLAIELLLQTKLPFI